MAGDTRIERRASMLERGLNILQAFRPTGNPLTLAALQRRTGLPKGTLHRLTEQLTDLGLLARAPQGFVPGIALFELGELVPVKLRLRETALPFMQDLYEATHETIHLGVRDDLDIVYAEKIRGHSGVDVPSRVGGRLPLNSTGVGKALLAYSGPDLIDAVLSRPLRTLTPRSISDPGVLLKNLQRVRAEGVAYDHQEAALGVSCVAAPILVAGAPAAAMSISIPSEHQTARLAPAIRATCLALGRALDRSA